VLPAVLLMCLKSFMEMTRILNKSLVGLHRKIEYQPAQIYLSIDLHFTSI